MRVADGRSTMRSVASREVEKSQRPSAPHARSVIALVCPSKRRTSRCVAESKTRIDELTKQMNVMVAKKVGHATTVDDVYEAYPDIEKEVDDEIDKHEWAKDAV